MPHTSLQGKLKHISIQETMYIIFKDSFIIRRWGQIWGFNQKFLPYKATKFKWLESKVTEEQMTVISDFNRWMKVNLPADIFNWDYKIFNKYLQIADYNSSVLNLLKTLQKNHRAELNRIYEKLMFGYWVIPDSEWCKQCKHWIFYFG